MQSPGTTEKVGRSLAEDSIGNGSALLNLRYGLEDKPGVLPSLLFGLQHVLVMFTAMIAAPLVIGQLLDLSFEIRTTMLTGVMLGCGIGTIISSIGFFWVGARLPLLLGAYAVYIGPVVAMAKGAGLATATSTMLIGGGVLFFLSPLLGTLRSLFPPLVVGTLLLVTSETLIRIAVNIAAAVNTPYVGKSLTIFLSLRTSRSFFLSTA